MQSHNVHFTSFLFLTLCATLIVASGMLIVTGAFADSIEQESSEQYGRMHLSIEEIEEQARIVSQNLLSVADIAAFSTGTELSDSVDLLPLLAYDPETRNQGSCGNCWVWSGTGAISITQMTQTGVYDELSIQYTNSLMNNGGATGHFACDGGNSYYLSNFYMNEGNKRLIPVSNTNAEYADGNGGQPGGYEGGYKTNMPAENIIRTPHYPIVDIYPGYLDLALPQNVIVDVMKSMLDQGYPIDFLYGLPNKEAWDEFNSFWVRDAEDTLFPMDAWDGVEYNEMTGGRHLVLIVGYDETDPDPANHSWNILNSWGAPENRPAGTFRMPMYINYQSKAPNVEGFNFAYSIYFIEFDSPTLISLDAREGYVWSEDKTLLTITESGSYAFANTEFGEFGIYIDAPEVNLDGRKWISAKPTEEQVTITGHRWVIDGERALIGIYGDVGYMATLNLAYIDIALEGAIEDNIVGGVFAVQNILESSIVIHGADGNIIDGIEELYGSFDNSVITILAADGTVSTGIWHVHGTIVEGEITITAPRLTQDFIIIGVEDVFGTISGGSITLTGDGSGLARGVSNLMGTITDGTFTIRSDEVYAVEEMEGGTVAGGIFNLHGYSFVTGIGEMHSNAVLSGGTFVASSNNWAAGIEFVQDKSTVSGGAFDIFGKEAVGILTLEENSVVQTGEFKVQGTDLAVGLYILTGTSVVGSGATFHASVLNPDGATGAVFMCMDGVISGGEFHAVSSGDAFALIENECTISDGTFWAVSPSGGFAVGIFEATVLPAGGEFNAWAQTYKTTFGIVSPELGNGKEIQNYSFVYDGQKFTGTATEYSVRSATVREIYDTDEVVPMTARPDMEALVIPGVASNEKDSGEPYVISFTSRPGYDLESILERLKNK